VNINVQKAQLLAMLSILMVAREQQKIEFNDNAMEMPDEERDLKNPSGHQQKIFFLKAFLASRLYKNYIGNERVSTEHAVENILRYNYSKDQPQNFTFSSVDVPIELRKHYERSHRLERDYIGQSMLNGLTFLKLCVLKCMQTMAMLNRTKPKN